MDVFAIEKGKALELSVDEFEKQTCHAYNYKAVNKYNIPYAMLRYQKAISIYHTFLFDSPMNEIVKERISGNSKYFEIRDKEGNN